MQKIFAVLTFAFLFAACAQQQEKNRSNTFVPKVVEAKGYDVPKDSMAVPKIILVDESKLTKIPAGKLDIIPTNTNVHIAGEPKNVLAGMPKICTPGQDTFLLPKTVPALSKPLTAGIPEVVLAKDAYIKDPNPQNFSTFGKLQGLKHDQIRCMIQDKSGNLWIGTDGGGVSKYDGKYFTHYTIIEGLSNNRVYCILQDINNNLWFGTEGGVSKYDGKFFTNFTIKEGLSNNRVHSILQDKSGNLWFGTNSGLNKYDGKSFTHFTEKEGLSNNTVVSILQDKSGNLWFGTHGGGVSKYNGKSFTHFTEKEGLSDNRVHSIFQDTRGNLWFGTWGGGVSKYDGKSFTHFTEKEGLSNNIIRGILQDKSGNLWFSTWGGGVSKYNGKSFTHFTEKEGLSNNYVMPILLDKSGNLWFGTDGGGVSKYDGKSFTHSTVKEGLSNNRVYSILQDRSGNLWLGSVGGVNKYDGKSFTHFTEIEGLSNNMVISTLQDKSGNLWFGTWGEGVSRYDGKSFTRITEKEGLSNNYVYCILQDKSRNLWFGTDGGGVSKYDGKSFTHFTEKEGLSNNKVLSILQDTSGNLWFGTWGGGLSRYNGKSFTHFTEKEGLSNNIVNSILLDKSGNLWVGTNGGVNKYDGKSFTHFTEKEGLINNNVFSILQDKSGNLWFGTRFGLCKLMESRVARLQKISDKYGYSPEGKENVYFTSFAYDEGFLGIGCNRSAICEDNTGTIWIGAADRLTAFHPEGTEADTIPPNIQLTSIDLFNENIAWVNLVKKNSYSGLESDTSSESVNNKEFAIKDTSLILGNGVRVGNFKFDGLTTWYNLPENLSLAYNNNYLTFSFIGITQKQSKKVKYQYKLEGLDDNWSAITSRTEAPYGNLPHGNYTFKVKAMNSEGYWSSEYNYSFTIRPPWWKTLWFRVFELIFIVFSIAFYIKWRERKLRMDKRMLEETVKVRTAEVVSQKEHIEHIHEEVSQSIDYATRIQTAILPEVVILKQYFAEHFVLLMPKDKVSGDFYWWAMVENHLVISVADCTGHGVPGAFMSMLGISFLREIVIKECIINPDIILKRLRTEIIYALKQKGTSGEQKDGMDMVLVTINIETLKIQFAGANNPLYIISSLNNELIKINGDKMPVAIHEHMENFTNHEFQLQKGDSIYLLTDGFEDQFGGPNCKKFMSKQLKELLASNSQKSMSEQNQVLEKSLKEWIGEGEQTDDITVVGLRI
jgi:ligand-binding sensor domain-containing protein/serine phosphatase RsbU (regulator of sigma subunit)